MCVCQSWVEHQTKTFPESIQQEAPGAHFSTKPMPELAKLSSSLPKPKQLVVGKGTVTRRCDDTGRVLTDP